MYHLRQVFTTIGVVSTMYVIGSYSGDLAFHLMLPDIDGAVLASRVIEFVLGLLAGFLLMRLLTWRFRIVAMLVLPTLIPFAIATYAWSTLPKTGWEMSFLDALAVSSPLFTYVVGMLAGAFLAHFVFRERNG